MRIEPFAAVTAPVTLIGNEAEVAGLIDARRLPVVVYVKLARLSELPAERLARIPPVPIVVAPTEPEPLSALPPLSTETEPALRVPLTTSEPALTVVAPVNGLAPV